MSHLLAAAGVLVAAGAAAAAILLPRGRPRAVAMLVAIALFPILLLGDQWHLHQIVELRHDTGRVVALLTLAAAIVAAFAAIFRRWPILLPLAVIAALPFRVPLEAGGETANLLVPLYLVIAGGVVASLLRDWSVSLAGGVAVGVAAATGPASRSAQPRAGIAVAWLPKVLAAVVVLYALQSLYSEDFSKALQNACFFLVPFTVAYGLLRDVEWDRRLLALALCVVGVEAVAFVVVGSVEYLTRGLFWNPQVIRSNEFHTYFRVNSVFWDPNLYGRYLALVLVLVAAALLWTAERSRFWLLTALAALLWIGLAPTFSESSFAALLAGLAVLAALRWSVRWTLLAVVLSVVCGVAAISLSGGFSLSRINPDTSGRADLVSGGVDLFGARPLWGYGSGSFQRAYRDHADKDVPVSISHTEPVTVAAEQGLIGLIAYISLIVTALWTMGAGLRAALSQPRRDPRAGAVGRVAVLAAFVALLVHTLAYAGFYEDPVAWVLLALGAALAAAPTIRDAP